MSATNEYVGQWAPLPQYAVHASVLKAANKVYRGTLAIQINGIVYNMDQNLTSYYLTVPGADANGGVVLWSKQDNVRYRQVSGGANKKEALSVVFGSSTIDVTMQLETDGMGVVTSTGLSVATFLLSNAFAQKYFQFSYTGTGLGLAAISSFTLVPQAFLLGLSETTYDNAAGVVDLVEPMRFYRGAMRLGNLSTDPVTSAMIGSQVSIVDCNTVKATLDPLSQRGTLLDIDLNGAVYVSIV